MTASETALFAVAFFAFAASPGPDNLAIMARAASWGAVAGIAYGAGVVVAIVGGFIAVSLGLGMAAAHLGGWWSLLRLAGAAYLIWTGFVLWRTAAIPPAIGPTAHRASGRSFAAGVAMNLANPKMPIFYLAVLPASASLSPSPGTLAILISIILLVEAVVIATLVALARFTRVAARGHLVRLKQVSAVALIGAGLIAGARR